MGQYLKGGVQGRQYTRGPSVQLLRSTGPTILASALVTESLTPSTMQGTYML